MWIRRAELRRILEQVKAADVKVLAAESALALERRENRQQERHFASMWLRHNKSLPLPKTADEKEEAKVEAEEAKNQPQTLTDVQLAMREANRKEAARHGISPEDADKDFEKYMAEMMEQ